MILKDVLKDVKYEIIKGDTNVEINDICYNSKKVKENDAFIALVGHNMDGHNYISDAITNGAKVIFVEKDIQLDNDVTVIKLDDTRRSLALLSSNLFGNPSKKLKMIGITGTKGKTTTTWMIKRILEEDNKTVGVIGTMGVFIKDKHYDLVNTTPESYEIHKYLKEMVDNNIEYAVMEVSSQALKLGRTDGITFDYGVFTNLTHDHIGDGEHASMEEYIECKNLLFKQSIHGVFNLDDNYYNKMIEGCTCDIHTFGYDKKANLCCEKVELLREKGMIGINMTTSGVINDTFKVNTPGTFSAYNAMCAMLTTFLIGCSTDSMKKALSNIAVKGRVEPIPISNRFNLLIDYAHNGVSTESILTTIREYNPKRIVTIFGCGGNRSKDRRYEMGEVSGKLADFSIITADNSRYEDVNDIINDILVGMHKTNGKYITIQDRKEAIKYGIVNAEEGDIILLLGKGHEDYQEIKGVRYPFDERVIIKEILSEIDNKNL